MSERGSWLTVDQGNTNLDVAWFQQLPGEERGVALVRVWFGLEAQGLEEVGVLVKSEGELRVLFSSVRGEESTAELRACLTSLFGAAAAPDPGLELDLETPETTGSDRLFAARAASELARGEAAVVLDVGTAMTVDLVRGRVFLGGAIAAGPRLLATALGAGGAQLFDVRPQPGARALGKSSRAALRAGVVVGLRGAARALTEELALELGERPSPEVFVTGGARELLLVPTGFLPATSLVEVPLLVHLGLLFASGLEPAALCALDALVVTHSPA
jgi:pantothenate kinase type III